MGFNTEYKGHVPRVLGFGLGVRVYDPGTFHWQYVDAQDFSVPA